MTPSRDGAVEDIRAFDGTIETARVAFLALIFVLAREGIALDDVSLLRRVSFQADDPQDPLILTRYINIHLSETRRTLSLQGVGMRTILNTRNRWCRVALPDPPGRSRG
ncbi:hypothetical protein ABGB12_08680 [Actinocorallia sp. B10E7]|uniref:hypothetical protein n=1 Tax=Actinocorallia sp. B10E7 TaxID=3153558 RepID=UPI00325CA520